MLAFGIVFWLVIGLLVLGTMAFLLSVLIRPEADEELVVHQDGRHTLCYAVPTGQDPSELVAALHLAGFTAVAGDQHGIEILEVAVDEEHDRGVVRQVLEHAHRRGFDSAEVPVGAVSFEDER